MSSEREPGLEPVARKMGFEFGSAVREPASARKLAYLPRQEPHYSAGMAPILHEAKAPPRRRKWR